jgi:hypothetical protein
MGILHSLLLDHVPVEPWLFKRIPDRREAACNLWNMNGDGDQKENASEKSCLPTAATLPSDEREFRHFPA